MTNEDKLRNVIRELIQQELDEMTTTGNVAGYNIPMAFQGNNPKNKARKKGIATQLGMQLTPRGQKDLDRGADKMENISEGKMRYHEYKKDKSASPTQKIAKAISEVNKNLQEMERVLKMNTRLQKESGIASEALYRRTQQGLLKLEARLLHLAGKVRDIRGK
jgi:CHAT domain-containing protein